MSHAELLSPIIRFSFVSSFNYLTFILNKIKIILETKQIHTNPTKGGIMRYIYKKMLLLFLILGLLYWIFHMFRSVTMENWLPRIVSYHGLENIRLPDAPASVAMRYWCPVCGRYNQDKCHSLPSPLSQWEKTKASVSLGKCTNNLSSGIFDLVWYQLTWTGPSLMSKDLFYTLKDKVRRKGSFERCKWWTFQSISHYYCDNQCNNHFHHKNPST